MLRLRDDPHHLPEWRSLYGEEWAGRIEGWTKNEGGPLSSEDLEREQRLGGTDGSAQGPLVSQALRWMSAGSLLRGEEARAVEALKELDEAEKKVAENASTLEDFARVGASSPLIDSINKSALGGFSSIDELIANASLRLVSPATLADRINGSLAPVQPNLSALTAAITENLIDQKSQAKQISDYMKIYESPIKGLLDDVREESQKLMERIKHMDATMMMLANSVSEHQRALSDKDQEVVLKDDVQTSNEPTPKSSPNDPKSSQGLSDQEEDE